MPPLNTIRWRCSSTALRLNRVGFWKFATKAWATEINDFVDTTGGLKKVVADMVKPEDTEDQKSRKIYAAVMKLENTDYSRTKSKAERKAHRRDQEGGGCLEAAGRQLGRHCAALRGFGAGGGIEGCSDAGGEPQPGDLRPGLPDDRTVG